MTSTRSLNEACCVHWVSWMWLLELPLARAPTQRPFARDIPKEDSDTANQRRFVKRKRERDNKNVHVQYYKCSMQHVKSICIHTQRMYTQQGELPHAWSSVQTTGCREWSGSGTWLPHERPWLTCVADDRLFAVPEPLHVALDILPTSGHAIPLSAEKSIF